MDDAISRFDVLSKMLDVANLRHQVIAQNVANVNTPGYHRLEVSFEDVFARQMQRGGPQQKAALEIAPQIVEGGGPERVDGNNVDIDAEMGRLTKNALLMNAFTQILASRISAQRAALAGR
jgi:flagellar basal-body rod protein FlgB